MPYLFLDGEESTESPAVEETPAPAEPAAD